MKHTGRGSIAVLVALGLCACFVALSDEGMWTFDNPPLKQLREKYNFVPTQAWLDHVRLASARLSDGGSGAFVSPHGLLLTNHHVARDQLQKDSTAAHDYIKNGFYAQTEDEELKAPDLEVDVLVSMENVTSQIVAAVSKTQGEQGQFAARKAEIAKIEQESLKKTGLRSDVVTLYQGGEYWLYRYKKYTDVRIVFAPEQQIAYFGGDFDNFTYPRYDVDIAFFRVYENGKPIETKDYLKWNSKGALNNELVFTSGNPGDSDRLDTMSQLLVQRDTELPLELTILKSRIAVLDRYSAQGSEQAREADSLIFDLANSLKAIDGMHKGLLDKDLIAKKQREEDDFKSKVMSDASLKSYRNAWDIIANAEAKAQTRVKQESFRRLSSTLAQLATTIVDYVAEIKKPDGERLPGFHVSQLDSLKLELYSPAPIYPAMEEARLAGALMLSREQLGPDDAFIKTVLDGQSPEEVAKNLVENTKLANPEFRKKLVEGGQPAVDESTDAMIVMARKLDPMRREMIKWLEDNVESVLQRAGEQLGKARFAVYGKSVYPDATFTLRLSYGTVKGYPMNGTKAPSKTTLYGLYDRAASFDYESPFELPERYKTSREKLDLSTPMNFVTTDDILGGNSGSPVINRNGEIVGVIFDGNIESLAGDYVYQEEVNRAVAVHPAVIIETLRNLFGAGKLADEIEGKQ
jgi:hypothetical protein